MRKPPTEREKTVIRGKLIESCRTCWKRFGYKKTSVSEIAAMSGISTGAFYSFFESKELLFLETAGTYENELITAFHANMSENPNKHGVASSLKAVVVKMRDMPWLNSMWEEWPVIMRKLPPDYMQKDFLSDQNRITTIIEQYALKPRLTMEDVTRIVDILLASVTRLDFIPGDTASAVDFIIDSVVDNLFE